MNSQVFVILFWFWSNISSSRQEQKMRGTRGMRFSKVFIGILIERCLLNCYVVVLDSVAVSFCCKSLSPCVLCFFFCHDSCHVTALAEMLE